MRLEQVLYHENLCGWNNYYTTRTRVSGWSVRFGKLVQFVDQERSTRLLSFISIVIFIDGINICIKIIFPYRSIIYSVINYGFKETIKL